MLKAFLGMKTLPSEVTSEVTASTSIKHSKGSKDRVSSKLEQHQCLQQIFSPEQANYATCTRPCLDDAYRLSSFFFPDVMMINQSPRQHQAFKQQRHLCGYRNFFRIFLVLQKQRSLIYDYLDYWNRPQLCSTTKLFQTIPPGKSPTQARVWTLTASL